MARSLSIVQFLTVLPAAHQHHGSTHHRMHESEAVVRTNERAYVLGDQDQAQTDRFDERCAAIRLLRTLSRLLIFSPYPPLRIDHGFPIPMHARNLGDFSLIIYNNYFADTYILIDTVAIRLLNWLFKSTLRIAIGTV